MFRVSVLIVATVFGTSVYAQSAPPQPRTKHHKATTPTAQTADDPEDVSKVPANVQKWIGGAVDDILTGADKTLGEAGGKR